ncbi:DUF3231 family protein [Bacillus sp. 1NLA3E]|uniref:DUF3231 family protein n=1 Tax=Bacillus sp. 1NLA3E TaxID=666686 RepID=UPI000247E488|nr:hypothetical protein B1NLA3E_21125 [Bacillus sp. 1NLA3E]
MVTEILLNKGLSIRPPYITPQHQVEFVKKQSFLSGWFGEKRPLVALEISHLATNIQTNAMGRALAIGFAQTAKTADVRDYMVRVKEIAKKHIEIFHATLTEESLPAPMTWDSDILDSTKPPFSDKLMMYHICLMYITGIGNYGTALSQSIRKDLIQKYTRLISEVGLLAEDGANLTIKHGWMECPPQAPPNDLMNREQ